MQLENAPELTLAESLLTARAGYRSLQKDGKNPHFRSEYVTLTELLDAVVPSLIHEGILLSQPVSMREVGGRIVQVVSSVVSKAGEELRSEIMLPDLVDPQKIGSAITYYRRYTLQALLALAAEDDDGNATMSNGRDNHKRIQEEKLAKGEDYIIEHGSTLKGRALKSIGLDKAINLGKHLEKYRAQLSDAAIKAIEKRLKELRKEYAEMKARDEEAKSLPVDQGGVREAVTMEEIAAAEWAEYGDNAPEVSK